MSKAQVALYVSLSNAETLIFDSPKMILLYSYGKVLWIVANNIDYGGL